jgi:hypothetical protein
MTHGLSEPVPANISSVEALLCGLRPGTSIVFAEPCESLRLHRGAQMTTEAKRVKSSQMLKMTRSGAVGEV